MKPFREELLIVMMLGTVMMMLSECRLNPSIKETSAFSNVEYVKEFPIEIEAKCSKEIDLGRDNICAFTVCDSLMLCSTRESQKYIKVLSWPGMRPLKEFINKGNGPYELTSNLLFFEENVEKNGDDILLYYYDEKNSIFKINISKSLKQGSLVGNEAVNCVGNNVYCFTGSEDDGIIVSRIENSQKKINRYLYKNNEVFENEILNSLNEIHIAASNIDYNILGRHTIYHKQDKKIVEAFCVLNLINIYSLDGKFQKSICVGHKLDNLKNIESMPYGNRPSSSYSFLKGYGNHFAAMYRFRTSKELLEGKRTPSEIRIFDWNGDPLCRIKLDKEISSFHIDQERGEVVGMDINGIMYFYDIDLSFLT